MDPSRRATSDVIPVGAALVAGVAGALSPPAPTGRPAVDAAMVGLSIAAVTFVAGRAPWWAVAALAGAALTIAIEPLLIVVALAALALALWASAASVARAGALASAAGLGLNVLARAELDAFLGSAAVVSIAAAALVFVLGVRRHGLAVRRAAWLAAGVVTVSAVLAIAGFGFAAAQARGDLAAGVRAAEAAVKALEDGEFEVAADEFTTAAEVLERAHDELSSPWAAAASFVPVVAQHRVATVDMSDAGAVGAAEVAAAIEDIQLDSLRAIGGRVDLAAVSALREPFTRVHAALDRLGAAVRASRSPWLVNRARVELDDFELSIAEHLPSLESAIAATELAPDMLGADRPQVYLVLFTTPSEARGLSGFVGSYAELTADGGQLGLSRFGRAQQLDQRVLAAGVRLDGPAGFRERYGRFGFGRDGGGTVGDAAFRNLTMTPNYPWVGEVARELYTQATGRTVDGVIAIDPYVVAKLLAYTGPIELTTLDQELTADNAASFLLRDQYVIGADDNTRRIDALAEAARLTFDAVLASSLPDPTTLAEDLGPLADERRLLVWSPEAAEQDLFRAVGMAGDIPPLDGADGWSVAVTNGGGNKIDTFLQRAAGYDSTTDPTTGETTATLRVVLTNTAPADGLPDYVIGNRVGAPQGTSRLYVSFYSPLALTGATVDGEQIGLEVGEELGWNVYSRFVDIPPGGTSTFVVSLAGPISRFDEIVTWEQPMTLPLDPLDG